MFQNKRGVFLLPLLLIVGFLRAEDLEMKKRAGPFEVMIKIDKNPPSLGNNKIEITIADADGTPVTDVDVLVNYYMPPMPRMAPMNYKTKAKLKDVTYKAKMKLIMEGPWVIAVKISRGDRHLTARFSIDAR